MTYKEMIRYYNRKSAAHTYIVGFARNGKVYYVTISWEELTAFLKADHESSSRGGALKARVRVPAGYQVEAITSGKAVELCDVAELAVGKYNRGENFERVITETLTETVWVKDSIPFYKQGDIQLNGEEIQVKFNDAELTNEKTIARTKKLLGT